jgi:uncharacterized membrane protein (DUF485 family)
MKEEDGPDLRSLSKEELIESYKELRRENRDFSRMVSVFVVFLGLLNFGAAWLQGQRGTALFGLLVLGLLVVFGALLALQRRQRERARLRERAAD